MKKVTLLIVLMMMVALTTYAADIAVAVTGSSTLTFGVNLNDPIATGFTNANDQDFTFTLVSGDSKKGAEEAVYGYIEVTGWSLKFDSDSAWATAEGTLTAKIIFPNGFVKISGTNNSLNYQNIVQNDNAVASTDDNGINDSLAANGGLVLGLNFAPIAIEIGFFSETDWTVDNNYGVNIKATVDVAPIKVEAGFETGLNHSDTGMGAGGKITASLSPLTIYAGADVTIDGEVIVTEFGGGVSVAVAGITLSADASMNEDIDGLDVRVKADAGGLVPNLGLSVTLELFNLLGAVGADLDADAEYSVAVSLSYTTPKVKPYANVRYGTFTVADNAYTYAAAGAEPFKLNIGAELYLITNFVFEDSKSDEDARVS